LFGAQSTKPDIAIYHIEKFQARNNAAIAPWDTYGINFWSW